MGIGLNQFFSLCGFCYRIFVTQAFTQAQSDVMKTCLSYEVKLSNLLKLLATKDVLQVLLAIDIQKLYISNPVCFCKKILIHCIKHFSCSTELSMKFQFFIEIAQIK